MFENINSRYIMKTGADYALLIFCGIGIFKQSDTPYLITSVRVPLQVAFPAKRAADWMPGLLPAGKGGAFITTG